MLFAYLFPIFDAFPRDHEWQRLARHHSKTFDHSYPMTIFSYLFNLRDRWFPSLSTSNISVDLYPNL